MGYQLGEGSLSGPLFLSQGKNSYSSRIYSLARKRRNLTDDFSFSLFYGMSYFTARAFRSRDMFLDIFFRHSLRVFNSNLCAQLNDAKFSLFLLFFFPPPPSPPSPASGPFLSFSSSFPSAGFLRHRRSGKKKSILPLFPPLSPSAGGIWRRVRPLRAS